VSAQGDHHYNLGLAFEDIARRHGSRTALHLSDGRTVTFAALNALANRTAHWLLTRGVASGEVVAIFHDKSPEAYALMLACLRTGAIYVNLDQNSPTARLQKIIGTCLPRCIIQDCIPTHGPVDAPGVATIDLHAPDVTAAIAACPTTLPPACAAVTGAHPAYIMFTSGSTGFPKGVPNTHRMLVANQEMIAALWPFLGEGEPPTLVDWLPWSHTFGGNHNFHLVLRNGGTLYVDRGRPAPGLVEITLRNMADVGPTIWFNVPRGFDQAVLELERDPELARAAHKLAILRVAADDVRGALRELTYGLEHSPKDRDLATTCAWLLSTAPDAADRDGAKALALVQPWCDAEPGDPGLWNIRAAALAELGRFQDAVRSCATALELTGPDMPAEARTELAKRLELYRQGRPYRLPRR